MKIEAIHRIADEWKTELSIDAMYYHASRQAHERAILAEAMVSRAEKRWSSLEAKWNRIEKKHKGNLYEAYDDLEPISIQMEDAHYGIGKAYGPLLKEVAVVHILSTATLEAHINSLSKETLDGKACVLFERLSLETKWLFLPKMLNLNGFDPGKQPFQNFSQLIKYRDKLIHYKGIQEPWIQGAAPEFIKNLGLTITDSEKSLKTVDGMIRTLARLRGVKPSFWLRSDLNAMSYFELAE